MVGLNQSPQTDMRTEIIIAVCNFNQSSVWMAFTMIKINDHFGLDHTSRICHQMESPKGHLFKVYQRNNSHYLFIKFVHMYNLWNIISWILSWWYLRGSFSFSGFFQFLVKCVYALTFHLPFIEFLADKAFGLFSTSTATSCLRASSPSHFALLSIHHLLEFSLV
jgi:hypothetical protein